MKKSLLLLAAVSLTMSASATITVSGKSNASIKPGVPSLNTKKFGSLKTPSVFSQTSLESIKRGISRADDAGFNVITEAPEGKLVTMLGSSQSFYILYEEINVDETYGLAYDAVFTDNNEVYLKNPVNMLDFDTYIKGEVTEDGLKFDFPQPFFRSETDEGTFDLYVDVLELAEVPYPDAPDEYYTTFIPAEDTRSIIFTKMEDGSYMMEGEHMLGVTYNDYWQGYGEMALNLLPFEATTAQIPEGIEYDFSYVLADELMGWDHTILRSIGIGELDGVTYISGLASGMPDAVIYGTFDKEKNTLTIPSNQFLGKYYNHYIFFMSGLGKTWYDEDWEEEMISYEITDDPLVLNYDPETNVYTPVIQEEYDYVFFMFNYGNIETYLCEYYAIDRIYSQGEITDYAPINPEILSIYDISFMDPEYSYAFEFNIYGDNNNGQILQDNNIYYNIFINGELYTFTAEEYPSLLDIGVKEITDIPVFLNAGDDIFTSGNYHGIALKRTDVETVGVRAVYIDGDTRAESEIVTVTNTGEPVSVAINNVSSAAKTEFFDLTGRKISGKAANGMILKRTILRDGTVRTEKIMK